jgi:hypothetical protein
LPPVKPEADPLLPPAVCTAEILIIPGIVAFARKIAAINRVKMKQSAVLGIGGRWNHQRKRSAHILDTIDVES